MRELVEVIAKALVDHPEEVEVIETSKEDDQLGILLLLQLTSSLMNNLPSLISRYLPALKALQQYL